jgi:UDP-N-acetyl-2-amino-2-deoxyglucuronate dehydrogenase
LVGWLFGDLKNISVSQNNETESTGTLQLERANVKWHLSINSALSPKRQLNIDGKTYEFTDGFTDLHTQSYREILNNNGFTIRDVQTSVDIVEKIRNRYKYPESKFRMKWKQVLFQNKICVLSVFARKINN